MALSDQSVSFGDFSGLDDATYEKLQKILHGVDGPKQVEFPWNAVDVAYQDEEHLEPRFCPVDAVPAMARPTIFVQQYPVPPGIFPVPAVVTTYPVPPMVNGLALGQPFPPQAVATVPREPIYPPGDVHIVNHEMSNGPTEGVNVPVYSQTQTAAVPPPPQVNHEDQGDFVQPATTELDFVYSEPGSAVPVSTSSELIEQSLSDNSANSSLVHSSPPGDSSGPDRTNKENEPLPVRDDVKENASAEDVTSSSETNLPQSPPKSQPTSPPKPKSWAGLFKASNAIVTYVDDSKPEQGPTARVVQEEKKQPEPAKLPVSVAEDSAAAQLGIMLKTMKMNHSLVALQPRGLINRGNWCYINATLQALLACPPFYHLMKQLCEFSPLARGTNSSSTPILDSLIAFFKNFSPWSRHVGAMGGKRSLIPGMSFEPVNVYKMLQVIEANPAFKHGRQEDAEEFLNCILDGLHEEMAASIALTSENDHQTEEVQENGYDDLDNASDEEDSWQQVGPKKRSVQTRRAAFAKTPIADIFAGHIRSAVFKAVSKESATLEPFFTLKLDIQDEKICTVRDALEGLVSRESVQGYQCSKTNQEVEVVKKISLEELPPVLILHLKCFVFDKTGGSQKLMKKIDFDVDLNITKDLLSATAKSKIQPTHRSYKLFAVVFHHGKNSTGGHYTTDVYHPGITSWVHIDDSHIMPVPISDVLKYTAPRMPYLLYYRRTNMS